MKGEGGVGEMLTLVDKGGRGGLKPPFSVDKFCEQPPYNDYRVEMEGIHVYRGFAAS